MVDRRSEQNLEDLAASVLEGRPVDWTDAESHADMPNRGVVRQLRLVSAVVEVHRSIRSELLRPPSIADLITVPGTWGPLELKEHVGRGAFGDVYRAWDKRLDREVALKLLHQEDVGSAASSAIINEGRVLARVRHPNVVTIYGADRIDGRVGLWMEFVRGRTLEQLLAERGVFGPQEALFQGVDLCRAVSAVHHAGLAHRDIKAHNVMREDGGRIVLMDFGTGREPLLAGESTLFGSPLYLAPEIFRGSPATFQSDIYSLGVLLFHLVSKSYPVQGRTLDELRAAHDAGKRTWLRDVRPELSESFVTAIEQSLAADPTTRYQTAGEMEHALLRVFPGARTRHRKPLLAASIAIAAAAVVVGILTTRGSIRMPGLGQPHNANTSQVAAAVSPTDLATRRITLPPSMYIGRPSPDGRYLAYVSVDGDLCLHQFDGGQSRCLTNKGQSEESAESQIAISPDGKLLAYTWRTLDGTNELRLVGEDGKWPRVLLRNPDVGFPNPLQWSSDATQILTMLELAGGVNQLALVSPSTGALKPLKTFPSGQYHPVLSPDGRFIAFDQPQQNGSGRDIFIMSVEDASLPARAIVKHPSNDLFPLWTPDGHLLFASDRAGSLGLWSLSVVNGASSEGPELLVRDVGRLVTPLGLTRDGSLYYRLQNGMIDVHVQTVDLTGVRSPGSSEPIAANHIGSNVSSEWSPDGRYVAYVSMRGWQQNDRDSRRLTIHDTVSRANRELQPPLSFFIEPRWAPDQRSILIRGTDLHDREGIFQVDIATGQMSVAVAFPSQSVRSAAYQWSPDGSAVWYDKRGAIVSHDLVTGREEPILDYASESILRLQQWPGFRVSPDGRWIAYTGFTFANNVGRTVVKARPIGGAAIELASAVEPERVEAQDWTPDGGGVLLIKRHVKEGTTMVYEASLNGAPMRALGISMPAIRDLSLRRDGKAVTYTVGASTLEVWVMKNFLPTSALASSGR